MSEFGVDVRYPGDMYVPSKEETAIHKQIAVSVKNLVLEKINKVLKD